MRSLKFLFSSFWVILPLIAVYITSCAIATFIENDYGTSVANLLVYKTWWFNLLHLYLAIALICALIVSRAWKRKKYASILLHASFVVIVIGAGITRFFGFEGVMHIREGEVSSSITASQPTLNILALKDDVREFYFFDALLYNSKHIYSKKTKIKFFDEELSLSDLSIKKLHENKNDDTLSISFKATYQGVEKNFELSGSRNSGLSFDKAVFGDTQFFMAWGSRNIPLPFGIKLVDFELERYAGSNSPSSYASEVQVLNEEGNIIKPYRIFMNNVLDFDGYRFYQSSYDGDEKGTILSVNKDPGKNLTYIGYLMLIIGAIWSFFGKDARFRILGTFLQNQKTIALLFCVGLAFFHTPKLLAFEEEMTPDKMAEFVEKFTTSSKNELRDFATIQLQNPSGRIEPVDTIANHVMHKITKKDQFLGMSHLQMFVGMMLYPQIWRDLRFIYVKDDGIKKIIGLKNDGQHYASFSDFFDTRGYKLNNFVEDINQIDPAKRGVFEKELLKVDERVNLVYSIFSGSFLRIFPLYQSTQWLDPMGIAQMGSQEQKQEVSGLLRDFFVGFDAGVLQGKWEEKDAAVAAIKKYQKEYGGENYLAQKRIQAEIFLNQINFFSKLIIPYVILSLVIFISMLFCIIKNNLLHPRLQVVFYLLSLGLVAIHTIGLLLRWYVSDHSPWSNAYESMLYISWASGIAGVVFFRKYNLALAASMFLAGIGLFVANLGFMDPEITPLVPVLKSYWLNIHVSIITASYGFLALCFILGLISLILFVFRNPQRPRIDQSILSLYALNEMSMILGILMLSVGNFLGGVWANESWGRYWSWDPKETWALISIGVYAIILHLRFLKLKNMPYIFSLASIIGFYSILMTYFGVNYYLSGMHSYAAGDPIPIPSFVYYFIGVTILLGFISAYKAKLQSPV